MVRRLCALSSVFCSGRDNKMKSLLLGLLIVAGLIAHLAWELHLPPRMACQHAALSAHATMQADDDAFQLVVSCSIGKAPEKICSEQFLGALIDHAQALRQEFEGDLVKCLKKEN